MKLNYSFLCVLLSIAWINPANSQINNSTPLERFQFNEYEAGISPTGLEILNKKDINSIQLELLNYHKGAQTIDPSDQTVTEAITNNKFCRYEFENEFTSEYFNLEDGVRFNYIIQNKPQGNEFLSMTLKITTHYNVKLSDQALQFFSADNPMQTVFEFAEFKMWDAHQTLLSNNLSLNKNPDGNGYELIIKIQDDQAIYPITIDPLFRSLVLWTITSNDPDGNFGSKAVFADVNGDGYDDIVSSAPHYNSYGVLVGGVYVHLSGPYGVSSSPNFSELATDGFDFGSGMACAGDINDDGYQDIIAGAYEWSENMGGGVWHSEYGKVVVLYGCSYGIDTTFRQVLYGSAFQDRFGYAMDGVGDVNGDEFDDVVISSYWYTGAATRQGKVSLFYGSASGIATTPAWTYTEASANSYIGTAVSKAGDVNHDGYDDFLFAAESFNGTFTHQGKVWFFYGSASGPSATPDATYLGTAAEQYLGEGICGGMDVNNDGYDDFTIGSPAEGSGPSACKGAIRTYYGSATGPTLGWTFIGTTKKTGGVVSSAGDFNGDGFDDLLYSTIAWNTDACESNSQIVGLFLGSASGLSASPAWDNKLYKNLDMGFGTALAGGGDLNDDGFEDFIVGVPYFDVPNTNSGAVFIYYGSAVLTPPNPTPTSIDYFNDPSLTYGINEEGTCFVGDLDGNGLIDMARSNNGWISNGLTVYLQYETGFEDIPSYTYSGYIGNFIVALGDINADGYDDFASLGGGAYIFFGGATGINTAISPQINPTAEGSEAGWCMTASDVNGDDYMDIIVGDYQFSAGSYQKGAISIYFGNGTGIDGIADQTIIGTEYYQQFGLWISPAGDINGDGYNDFAVQSGMHNGYPIYDYGKVEIFAGSPTGLITTPISSISGTKTGQYLGIKLWEAGDVNGDGYDDLLVRNKEIPEIFMNEGEIQLYYGSPTGIHTNDVWIFRGAQTDANLGESFAGKGDYNNDGYDDLIVGAPGYVGPFDEGISATHGGYYIFNGSYKGLSLPNKIIEVTVTGGVGFIGAKADYFPDENGDDMPELIMVANGYGATSDELYVLKYLSEPTNCSTITSVTATPFTNSISLSWTGANSDLNYVVRWKETAGTVWMDTVLVNPEIIFTGLESCTDYQFVVQKICDGGSASWSDTVDVQTAGCPLPCTTINLVGITSSDITTNTATISWELSPYAINYQLQYKRTSDATWTSIISSTSPVILSGLTSCTFYDYKIRAICTVDTGNFSAIYNFETTCPACVYPPETIFVNHITTTSVKVNYGPVDGATKYKIWYRKLGTIPWTKATSAVTYKKLKSLTPNTIYEVKVQGICGETQGPFTPVIQFTTAPLKTTEETADEVVPVSTTSGFTVYPNPANGYFTVVYPELINSEYDLKIYSLGGQVVFLQKGVVQYSISVESDLPPGIYFIQMLINGKQSVKKIILQ